MGKRWDWQNFFAPEDENGLESERMARLDGRCDANYGGKDAGGDDRLENSGREYFKHNYMAKAPESGRTGGNAGKAASGGSDDSKTYGAENAAAGKAIWQKTKNTCGKMRAANMKKREARRIKRQRRRDEYRAMTPAQRAKRRRRGWKIAGLWALGAFGAMVVVLTLLLDFGSWVWLDEGRLTNLRQTTLMYDSDDVEVAGLYSGENRIPVDVNTLPDYVKYAFVSAEDVRFYSHHGIDFRRIGGAVLKNIKSGGFAQGASTISQQLIKLTHLSAEKTLARKANEAVLAAVLEMRYSKDEILEMYMNTAYFGHGAYGIEAAARAYFSKGAAQLDIAESALMAAVIKSPSGYAPHIKPERALKRRNWVLGQMREGGYISQEQYEAAQAQAIELNETFDSLPGCGWFVDHALAEAENALGLTPDELLAGGYRIYTTLDSGLQEQAQDVFAQAEFPADAADGTQCQGALCVTGNEDGAILALIGGREYTVRRGLDRATEVQRQPGSAIKPLAVYAPAVEKFGYLPSSFLNDEPTDFGGWMPRNAGGRYRGIVTLRKAAASSINVPTVELLSRIGVNAGVSFLNSAGINTDARDAVLPLALGAMTYGTSPLQMCGAYSAFAAGGVYTQPYSVRLITGPDGGIVYSHEGAQKRIMSEQSAYIMTSMLQSVVKTGTATRLNALGISIAAKTGTAALSESESGVSGNRDIWLCAYTKGLSMAVWMGFDRTDSTHYMPESASGSNQPTKLAVALLKTDAADEYTGGSFERPSGVREVLIDGWALENLHAVMLAGEDTPATELQREVFTPGALPVNVSALFAEPLPVYDLMAEYDAGGVPVLQFTCPQEYTEYRIYRTVDGTTELAGAVSGDEGQKIEFGDNDAAGTGRIEYTVVPYAAAQEKEGTGAYITLERGFWDDIGRMLGEWRNGNDAAEGGQGAEASTAMPESTEAATDYAGAQNDVSIFADAG